MNLSNKHIIIIVSVVVVVLLVAFYVTYRSGLKSGKNPSSIVITDDIVGTTVLDNDEKTYLKGLAINLFNDMDGTNISREDNLYVDVSLLSDTELVALSNIYNVMYEVETNETFLEWLKNEQFWWNSEVGTSTTVNTIVNRLLILGVS